MHHLAMVVSLVGVALPAQEMEIGDGMNVISAGMLTDCGEPGVLSVRVMVTGSVCVSTHCPADSQPFWLAWLSRDPEVQKSPGLPASTPLLLIWRPSRVAGAPPRSGLGLRPGEPAEML